MFIVVRGQTRDGKMIARKAMANLCRSIGRRVRIEFVDHGSFKMEEGFLSCVENRSCVELKGGLAIPFVGDGVAIQKIFSAGDNSLLYHNSLISANYRSGLKEMKRMRKLVWGMKKRKRGKR